MKIKSGPFAGMDLAFCSNDRALEYDDEAEAVFRILKVSVMFWSDPCTIYDYVDDRELAEMRAQLDELFRCTSRPDETLVDILERARQAVARRH